MKGKEAKKAVAEIALTINVGTKAWEGAIPEECTQVCLQFLDENEHWQPPVEKLLPREKKQAIDDVEQAVKHGPCMYKQYRLVPAPDRSSLTTEDSMAKAKKSAGKGVGAAGGAAAVTAKKEPTVLIGGRFREGSELALMYTFLLDGKARTIEEINAVTKSKVPANIGQGKFIMLKDWGQKSKTYDLIKTDDNKIQLKVLDKSIVKGGVSKASPPTQTPAATTKKGKAGKETPPPVETKTAVVTNFPGKKKAVAKKKAAPTPPPQEAQSSEGNEQQSEDDESEPEQTGVTIES